MKMILPGKIIGFVAETVNGRREGTYYDENGIVWRGDLGGAKCLVNGESQPTFAADAREGWADVRDEERRGICPVTPEQPHGVPTKRIYGQVEICVSGPLDRQDARAGSAVIREARMAVKALRQSADPMPNLADRLEAALNAEA